MLRPQALASRALSAHLPPCWCSVRSPPDCRMMAAAPNVLRSSLGASNMDGHSLRRSSGPRIATRRPMPSRLTPWRPHRRFYRRPCCRCHSPQTCASPQAPRRAPTRFGDRILPGLHHSCHSVRPPQQPRAPRREQPRSRWTCDADATRGLYRNRRPRRPRCPLPRAAAYRPPMAVPPPGTTALILLPRTRSQERPAAHRLGRRERWTR